MKRPIGVIVSAILLVPISLFQLLMAFLMGFDGAVHPNRNTAVAHPGATPAVPFPSWMPVFTFVISAFFLALAVWGIATVVGLLRLRRWARFSVLVIGGGMALIGLFSLLVLLVVMKMPLPAPPGADASHAQLAQSFSRMLFGILAVFYGLVLALGVFWLVYFNRKTVRDAFAHGQGKLVEERRPFMISLLALLTMIGAVTCLLAAFLPFPLAFLGLILHGWGKTVFSLAYAALQAAIGIGLWRMEEWGRRLTLAAMALGAIHCAVYLVRPSLMFRYSAEWYRSMNLLQPAQLPVHFQPMLYALSFGVSILFLLAIVAMLHHYRGRFRRPMGPQAEPMTLA